MNYPILVVELSAENGNGFLGLVPDLPGCMGDGETPELALKDAQGAIIEWLTTARASNRPVPQPGSAKGFDTYSNLALHGIV